MKGAYVVECTWIGYSEVDRLRSTVCSVCCVEGVVIS